MIGVGSIFFSASTLAPAYASAYNRRVKIHAAPIELRTIDRLPHRVVAAPVFEDERPPRGAAGIYDWRLCGRLSRLLQRPQFTGTAGDRLLFILPRPTGETEALILVGLGTRARLASEGIVRAMRSIAEAIPPLGLRDVGVELPGLRVSTLPPREILNWWLREAHAAIDDVTLLVPPNDYKAVSAILPGAPPQQSARAH
ncbi:MAG: hypothetical protein HYY84_04095 [Deltaproteobacteria bacterium]|nr:hypothetical protein [Deltaproteobacteria bacterium]